MQVLCGLSSSANVGPLAQDLLTFAAGGDEKPTSSTVASPTFKLRTTVSLVGTKMHVTVLASFCFMFGHEWASHNCQYCILGVYSLFLYICTCVNFSVQFFLFIQFHCLIFMIFVKVLQAPYGDLASCMELAKVCSSTKLNMTQLCFFEIC